MQSLNVKSNAVIYMYVHSELEQATDNKHLFYWLISSAFDYVDHFTLLIVWFGSHQMLKELMDCYLTVQINTALHPTVCSDCSICS